MSSTPTYHKSPWTSKVNSFLYENSFPTFLDGRLRHLLSLVDTRSVTTTTDTREDDQGARGMEDAKTVAWKRRRKRASRVRGGTTGPNGGTTASTALPPPLPPEPPFGCQVRHRHQQWHRYYRRRGTTAPTSGTTAGAEATAAQARTSGTTAGEPAGNIPL